MGHSFFSFARAECLVKGADELDIELELKDDSIVLGSDLGGETPCGDIGSCLTSPRKFSSISHASSFSLSAFCTFAIALSSPSSFVSDPSLFSDLLLLFGRGYPELVVQAVDDELDGDSLSEVILPNDEILSCAELKDSDNEAACLPAPLLDKLSNVATADEFSIKDGLFNA